MEELTEFAVPKSISDSVYRQGFGNVSYGDDDALYVEFHKIAVQNNYKSEQLGSPQFEEKDFVKIVNPGGKSVIDREATDIDKQRFHRHWERYEKLGTTTNDGYPLEHWPPLNVSQVAMLKALSIFSVEQLAAVSDTVTQKMQFGNELRIKAKAFLAAAKDNAATHKLAVENERQKQEIEQLREDIRTLANQIQGLQQQQLNIMPITTTGIAATATKKRKGRPPKIQGEQIVNEPPY